MSKALEVTLKESTSHPTAQGHARLTTGEPKYVTFRLKKERCLFGWAVLKKEIVTQMNPSLGVFLLPKQPIKWLDVGGYKGYWDKFGSIVGTTETIPDSDRFMQERDTFLRIKSRLVSSARYVGKFVAVHNGRVVGYDRNIVELARRMYGRYGYSPIYIGKAESEEQVVDLPSPEV